MCYNGMGYRHGTAREGAKMYVKLTIPERLKDLRVERHLTLEQLAAQTGLSKAALGQYETEDFKAISLLCHHYADGVLWCVHGLSHGADRK